MGVAYPAVRLEGQEMNAALDVSVNWKLVFTRGDLLVRRPAEEDLLLKSSSKAEERTGLLEPVT